jgi:hypothetical protein
MHGCAPGSGGPRGERSGKFKHGRFTREAKARRAEVREWVRDARAMLADAMRTFGLKKKRTPRSAAGAQKKLTAMFKSGRLAEGFQMVAEMMGQAVDEAAKPAAASRPSTKRES